MPIWGSFSVSLLSLILRPSWGASGAKHGARNSNFVLHWGSSLEELPKTIHANSPSGITKNVYFQPGRSWQQGVQVFGPTAGKYPKKSLIKYDRLDGSSPVYFPTFFPQGADLRSWHLRLMSKRGDIKAIGLRNHPEIVDPVSERLLPAIDREDP